MHVCKHAYTCWHRLSQRRYNLTQQFCCNAKTHRKSTCVSILATVSTQLHSAQQSAHCQILLVLFHAVPSTFCLTNFRTFSRKAASTVWPVHILAPINCKCERLTYVARQTYVITYGRATLPTFSSTRTSRPDKLVHPASSESWRSRVISGYKVQHNSSKA